MDSFNAWVQKLAKTDDPLKSTKLNQSLILAEMYPEKDPYPESEDPRPSIQEQQTSNDCMYYSPNGAATNDEREYTKEKVIKNEANLIKGATELSIFGKLQELHLEVKNLKKQKDDREQQEKLQSLIEENKNLRLTIKSIANAYNNAEQQIKEIKEDKEKQIKKLTLEKEKAVLLGEKFAKQEKQLSQDVSKKEERIVQCEEIVLNLKKRIAELEQQHLKDVSEKEELRISGRESPNRIE